MIVAFVLVAALAAAAAVAAMRLVGAGGAPRAQAPGGAKEAAGRTQELVSLADFDGPCAVSEDGTHVLFIEVHGQNTGFLTEREKDAQALLDSAAFAGQRRPFTLHRIQRPVDMEGPRQELRAAVEKIASRMRAVSARAEGGAQLTHAERKELAALAARRELIETVYLPLYERSCETMRYSIQTIYTFSFPAGADAVREAMEAADSFCMRMADAGYRCQVMSPSEVIAAEINYFGRYPAPAEDIDPYNIHMGKAV